MQNKSNKLPYVFVEIDEIEEQDALDPYGQSAAVMGYQPVPRAPFPPNMSGPMFPQMGNPYAPPIGPLAALQMTPQFQVGPYAKSLDMLDVEPDDDYLDDDYDFDYPEEDEFDSGDERESSQEPIKSAKAASEEEALNLETVVIPVFKNADSGQGKGQTTAQAQTIAQVQAAYPQPPILPTMPFMHTLPYAYNPFRTPFVNPMWAQPRISMMGAPEAMRLGAYSMGAQAAMQQRNQLAANARSQGIQQNAHPQNMGQGAQSTMHQQNMSQGAYPHNQQFNRAQGTNRVASEASNAGSHQTRISPGSSVLPMEALEAFEGSRSTDVPLPSYAARNIKAASNGASVAPNMPETISANHMDAASNEQTITASTDNVSVSVSVVQPKQSQANGMETASMQTNPAPQPQGQAAAVEHIAQNASLTGVPTTKGSKAKKKAAAPKAPKETFEEMAMRENAEKTHTSLTESDGVDQMGKPLLDTNAIETSDMFSAPATSMNDSMTGFQFRASRRKHVLMIVFAALILAIVIAAVVCVVAVWTGAATITFDESNVPSIQLVQAFEPK